MIVYCKRSVVNQTEYTPTDRLCSEWSNKYRHWWSLISLVAHNDADAITVAAIINLPLASQDSKSTTTSSINTKGRVSIVSIHHQRAPVMGLSNSRWASLPSNRPVIVLMLMLLLPESMMHLLRYCATSGLVVCCVHKIYNNRSGTGYRRP